MGCGVIWLAVAAAIHSVRPQLPDETAIDGVARFSARRLLDAPILTDRSAPALVAETERNGYVNLNGPSLIHAPSWIDAPLGRYYLYFAHHKGDSIRLAYADALAGPWTVHEAGVLTLANSHFPTERPPDSGIDALTDLWRRTSLTEFQALVQVGRASQHARAIRRKRETLGADETRPHIASPDVIVDEERRELRMYFHGLVEGRVQMTRLAVSSDGTAFTARPELLGPPYLRVARYRDQYYGLAMPGLLYRSVDGLADFEGRRRPLLGANTRHSALWWQGDDLYVFFTRVGDSPERILCTRVDTIAEDWNDWEPSPPFEVLRPERPWEGAEVAPEPSLRGESPHAVNELRDPAVFSEDGRLYLLYSVAGEHGIGIAELSPAEPR